LLEDSFSPISMPPSRSASHTSSHHDTLSPPNQRTPLLRHSRSSHSQRNAYHRPSCQQDECEHGALSPHASRPNSSSSTRPLASQNDSNRYTPTHTGTGYEPQPNDAHHHGSDSFGGKYGEQSDLTHGILGDAFADGILGDGTGGDLGREGDVANDGGRDGGPSAEDRWRGSVAAMSTTQYLARSHGVKGRRTMYVYRGRTVLCVQGNTSLEYGMVLIVYTMQVSCVLLSLPTMDNTIPLALPTRRHYRGPHNGLLLHPNVPLLRL